MISVVTVPVATLWSRPEAVRPSDAPALAARPDIPGWIAAMTPEQQVDTQVVTQLLLGERVLVDPQRADGWLRVAALDQPADQLDPRGYPGWLRAAHVRPALVPQASGETCAPPHLDVVSYARRFLGAVYVWGGLSSYGIDCSGLVHRAWRHFGTRLPRDAAEQAEATTALAPGDERPGDLYFFARPGQRIHHVGIVTEPGRMLHASSTAHRVVEEALTSDRLATLVTVARV